MAFTDESRGSIVSTGAVIGWRANHPTGRVPFMTCSLPLHIFSIKQVIACIWTN